MLTTCKLPSSRFKKCGNREWGCVLKRKRTMNCLNGETLCEISFEVSADIEVPVQLNAACGVLGKPVKGDGLFRHEWACANGAT